MSDLFWRMQSPVAFSAILMDEEMYKHLMSERAKNGLRIDGVPVQVRTTITGGWDGCKVRICNIVHREMKHNNQRVLLKCVYYTFGLLYCVENAIS